MIGKLTYRPDIDGLRGVSVLAVIAYHGGQGVPGGFVGVDVFFVISGFLITSLIAKDLERGTFSLANFWVRRIRRIWPATMGMTIGVLIAGYVLMMPNALHQLASDTIAQIVLLANVHFWRTTGDYFAYHAELRPLLHTWSLAVEEQFYIGLPILLMVTWKYGRPFVIGVLFLIAVLSLALSLWGVQNHPTPTFYLLPTRAWELMLGSLLALVRLPNPKGSRWNDVIAMCGLALILIPSLLYNDSTRFPGLAAVPPCLGTVALIYSGSNRAGIVFRGLAFEPIRVIGLMSFSLYLWHWPVMSFMRYTLGDHIPIETRLISLIMIIVLSFLSWRFIEMPIRKVGDKAGLTRVVGAAAIASGVLIAAGLAIRMTGGVPRRIDQSLLVYGEPEMYKTAWGIEYVSSKSISPVVVPIGSTWDERGPDFLIWGDSHGMAISEVVDEIAKDMNITGAAALRHSTPPIPGVWMPERGALGRLAATWNEEVLDWIREESPEHIILCAVWSSYLDENQNGGQKGLVAPLDMNVTTPQKSRQVFEKQLKTLLRVCEESGSTVWLLKEVPFLQRSPEQMAVIARLTFADIQIVGVAVDAHRRHQQSVESMLERVASPNLRIVDLAEPFFMTSGDSIIGDEWVSFYTDRHHINSLGTRAVLTPTLEAVFSEILRGNKRNHKSLSSR